MPSIALPPVYPILDTTTLERLGVAPVEAAEGLIEGGARILQLRHKTFWSRSTFELAEKLKILCDSAGVPFVVNDRADFAAILGSALHLGQDDLTPVSARRIVGRGAVIGFSTHSPEQMRAAASEPVDYVAFGPVFPTLSKERPDPTVGVEALRTVRALTQRPLVAIGGITRDNALNCRNAGADSLAIISDLFPASASKTAIRERMTEWNSLLAS